MGDHEKTNDKGNSGENKCYFCKQIKWLTYETPTKIHKFLYSKRNLFFVLLIAILTYFLTIGQSEVVRRTLATFVFAAGCWMLEVFPLAITGLMTPALLTLLGVFTPKDAFAPFANSIIFLMIGGLVLGNQ